MATSSSARHLILGDRLFVLAEFKGRRSYLSSLEERQTPSGLWEPRSAEWDLVIANAAVGIENDKVRRVSGLSPTYVPMVC